MCIHEYTAYTYTVKKIFSSTPSLLSVGSASNSLLSSQPCYPVPRTI